MAGEVRSGVSSLGEGAGRCDVGVGIEMALRAFSELTERARVRRGIDAITDGVDGEWPDVRDERESAADTPWAAELESAGFSPGYRGMTFRG